MLCIGPAPVNKHIPALLGFGLDVFDIACAANHGDIEGQPTRLELQNSPARVRPVVGNVTLYESFFSMRILVLLLDGV